MDVRRAELVDEDPRPVELIHRVINLRCLDDLDVIIESGAPALHNVDTQPGILRGVVELIRDPTDALRGRIGKRECELPI